MLVRRMPPETLRSYRMIPTFPIGGSTYLTSTDQLISFIKPRSVNFFTYHTW